MDTYMYIPIIYMSIHDVQEHAYLIVPQTYQYLMWISTALRAILTAA